MICMSFNVRGGGGSTKMLSLKRLVKSYFVNIILLQETMFAGSNVVEAISPWIKDWSFCLLHSNNLSRRILTTWIHNILSLSTSVLNSSILEEMRAWDLNSSFKIIKLYGSYVEKKSF